MVFFVISMTSVPKGYKYEETHDCPMCLENFQVRPDAVRFAMRG